MSFLVVGMSHHQTPEAIRQQYAISIVSINGFLLSISHREISLVILSTCNRLEIYLENMNISEAKEIWSELLLFCGGHESPPTYILRDQKSIEHTFKVALGLDSRVLREHQVLGQMRKAFRMSCSYHLISQGLRRLFERCFHFSKSIRSHWQKSSLGLLAAKYLANITKNRSILIIGAGDIVKDFLEHADLLKGVPLFLCNRTYAHALQAAKKCSLPIKIVPFSDLFQAISHNPILVVGISNPEPILTTQHFDPSLFYEIVDFGLPSILEPSLKMQKNISLKSLDSFENSPLDQEEEFALWLQIQQAITQLEEDLLLYRNRHLVVNYREKLTQECAFLTKQALLAHERGEDPALLIKRLAYKMQQKLLHWPSIAFKQSVLESHHLDSFYHSADAIPFSPIKSFESL
jgi:glutamyl-tRNA reductase